MGNKNHSVPTIAGKMTKANEQKTDKWRNANREEEQIVGGEGTNMKGKQQTGERGMEEGSGKEKN